MVPLKKVRKDTSRPSDSTLRTLALTSMPGSSDPIVSPSHSCTVDVHSPALQTMISTLFDLEDEHWKRHHKRLNDYAA